MVRITKSRDAMKAARLYFPLVLICLIHPIALYGIKNQSLKSLFSQPLKKQSDIRAQKRGEGIRARGEGGTLTSGKKNSIWLKTGFKIVKGQLTPPPLFFLSVWSYKLITKKKSKKEKTLFPSRGVSSWLCCTFESQPIQWGLSLPNFRISWKYLSVLTGARLIPPRLTRLHFTSQHHWTSCKS